MFSNWALHPIGQWFPTHELSFGSTFVPSYTVNSTPSLVKPSTTWCIASSFATVLSVTTHTLFDPMFLKSIPTSFVHPGPNRILEAAISKAYSLFLEESTGVARDRLAWLRIEGVGWWWPGLAWQGQLGGCVYWTVRRRFKARLAAVGAWRIFRPIAQLKPS